MSRAIVLLSGGLDSAVALFWARGEGHALFALDFDYHLRPARERECAAELAARAGAERLAVPLPFLREAVDQPEAAHLRDAPEGYIPARNLVFYAAAAYFAEGLRASILVGGHNREDAAAFPDAGRPFFEGLGGVLARGLWSDEGRSLAIVLPFSALGKAEVLRLGAGLGVPFEHTWSCYRDGRAPCRSCRSCQERARAFAAAGLTDPIS